MIWLMALIGCFTEFDKLPQIDQNDLPFEHPELSNKDVSVSMIETSLLCPDGNAASVFAVYPNREDPLPVAIVFHPDAVSYVTDYHLNIDERPMEFTAEWGEAKLWETLGMSRDPDTANGVQKGALASALADADFVQLYPMNCWGDYWHGLPGTYDNAESMTADQPVESEDTASEEETEESPQPNATPNFVRRGLEMAKLSVEMVLEPSIAGEQGFNIPQSTNPDELTLIGLGSGSRAVIELLLGDCLPENCGASPKSVVFDSGPMDLQPYLEQTDAFAFERQSIQKIFVDDSGVGLNDISQWSATSVLNYPEKTALLWSNGDSRIPQNAVNRAAALFEEKGITQIDLNTAGHVFSATDMDVAKAIVNFIQTGDYALPTTAEESEADDESETEEGESGEEG